MTTTGRLRFYAALAFVLAGGAWARADGPIALRALPPIAKGDAALPRVVAPAGDKAAARINAALASADHDASCGDQTGSDDYWSRTTTTTMRGPRYLSLLAFDDEDCGGPHPDESQETFVFDATTGAQIDWRHLFAAGVIESVSADAGEITSSVLWKLYAKAATDDLNDKDCSEVLADPSNVGAGLALWPDAEEGGLAIKAADFPHVVQACGAPETLSPAALRKLGVDPGFLADLAEAHRRGWYDKTPK